MHSSPESEKHSKLAADNPEAPFMSGTADATHFFDLLSNGSFRAMLEQWSSEEAKHEKERHEPSSELSESRIERLKERIQTGWRSNHDPDHVLNPWKDISRFINTSYPSHLHQVKRFAHDIGPLSESCELTFCIPVALAEEYRTIRRTLEAFLPQTAERESFEILLFGNYRESISDALQPYIDNTLDQIDSFCFAHPDMRVLLMLQAMPDENLRIGYLRRLLNDVVLQRYLDRGESDRDHILVRTDADLHGIHPEFVNSMLRLFKKYPKVDSFAGQLDFALEDYASDPVVYFAHRLYLTLERAFRIYGINPQIGGGGANFACRASAYAYVGGYCPANALGEDVNLGSRLHLWREGSKEHTAIKYAGSHSRIFTSARRGIAAMENGYSPVQQWSKKETDFGVSNAAIRTRKSAHASQYEELLHAPEFSDRVEHFANCTLEHYCSSPSDSEVSDSQPITVEHPVIRKVFGRLGIMYLSQPDPRKIKILDLERLKLGLSKFPNELNGIRWRKTGAGCE